MDLDTHEAARAPVMFYGAGAPRMPRDGLEPMQGPSVSVSLSERFHDLTDRRPMLVLVMAAACGWLLGKLGRR